mgnify:CR=1 FL=1
MNAARDADERDLMMEMRRRSNGHRIDARREQFIERRERRTSRHFGRARTGRRRGIDDTDQRHAGKTRQ